MIDVPYQLFLGFLAMIFVMVALGLKASPKIGMSMFMIAGLFVFIQVAIVDNIIMGYTSDYDTSYNNSTDIVSNTITQDNAIPYPFTDLEKLLYGIFGTTLIAIGAIILARDR